MLHCSATSVVEVAAMAAKRMMIGVMDQYSETVKHSQQMRAHTCHECDALLERGPRVQMDQQQSDG